MRDMLHLNFWCNHKKETEAFLILLICLIASDQNLQVQY